MERTERFGELRVMLDNKAYLLLETQNYNTCSRCYGRQSWKLEMNQKEFRMQKVLTMEIIGLHLL